MGHRIPNRPAKWGLPILLLAVSFTSNAPAQELILEDLLQGSSIGTRSGGSFVSGGWQVTNQYDAIYWHIPALTTGAAEWDIRGLFPDESRPAMNDKSELFHMYDYTFDNADTNYSGYRNNPYKHFVSKIGSEGGATDALELVWQISPNYEEPDTAVLSWDPNTTYHFREEWQPDGAGNSILRTFRDGSLLRTTSVPGIWNPAGLSVRLGAANPPGTRSAPIDAIYSNLRVWDLSESEPLPPLPEPRTGEVSLDSHALQDDQGEFLGLGASYFQALRRTKYDRGRYRSDLDFLARQGFNYIRTLSMVGGNSAWLGKEIAPIAFTNDDGQMIEAWPDYWEQLGDMIDIAYDEYGIRTQITLFADAQNGMPNEADRIAHMNGVLNAIQGREHKVIMLEVANESWQNGFPEPGGTTVVRNFGQYLADRTDVLVSLSSPDDTSNAGIQNMYQNSAADIATVHFSRDRSEEGWLPVRDPWRVNSIAGLPPASSNEPIGPGSSVSSENGPVRLVSAAAYAWMSGLPMYVYHTSAGVFGNTRFQDMAGVSNFQHLDDILPGDIANWPQRTEGKDGFAPFVTYANDQANTFWTEVASPTSGVVRHLSNVKGDKFYTLPISILAGGVQLQARQNMTLQAFNPLTGEVAYEMTPSAGQTFTLAQGPQAYIIKGRYAGNRPATIDLGAVDEIDGMIQPRGGDGDTVKVTLGGRDARANENPNEDFYMYFAVADWFAYQGNHDDLYVTFDYFDTGDGQLTLQYDSTAGESYQNGGDIALGGTDTWKQHTFHLTDAYFGNRQNSGADFRISGGVGNTFYLDRVMVSLSEPPPPPLIEQIQIFPFTVGTEGWTLETWKSGAYNPGTATWDAVGGSPSGALKTTGSGGSNNMDYQTREGSILTRAISLEGYGNLIVEYDVKVSQDTPPGPSGIGIGNLLEGSPEDKLVVYYSLEGTEGPWTVAEILSEELNQLPENWAHRTIDLSSVLGANDNSNFALRFAWQFNTSIDTGWLDNVRLSGVALSAPGDYNSDGIVDVADYTVWRDTLGSTTNLAADGNGSGSVDAGDYGVWKSRFGQTLGAGTVTDNGSLPEPTTFILWMLAAAGWSIGRCRVAAKVLATYDA
ncbi:MAG: hypothetical protein WD851_12345 [Pirellulales bacterium]